MRRLRAAEGPQSAGALAAALGVSRPLVVGDVALLRAGGEAILATPRGYVLERAGAGALQVTVACRHSAERLLEELLCVTDCGCGLLDVTVEHPVYGQITAPLRIFSRADAEQFAGAIAGTQPLCQLTGGVHLHTLSCPTPYHRDRALASLREKGFLLDARD